MKAILRRAATVLGMFSLVLAAAFGMTGFAEAAPTSQVNGAGVISYNGEYADFTVGVTGDPATGAASGSCDILARVSGTHIVCTSFYDYRVDAPNKVTSRGTATLNGRPISFTAVITDGGTGNQDQYLLYTAGRIIGGRLISGDVTISNNGDSEPQAS